MPGFWTLAVASLINGIMLLLSYVAQNSFPKPLTEEEEQDYLERLAKGDENAKEVLIERNLRLVAHIIKKFDGSGDDFDDLISIGTIGLIKAVNTFNGNKSSRLATYASKCIENEILMYMRSKKKMRSEMSLYEPIGTDKEGNEIHFMDVLSTDAETVAEKVARILDQEQLWRKLKNLTPQERKVLVLRFGLRGKERKTQKEIAKKLGISRSYVSRIEKRAIDRLSEQFLAEA
ncbi:RNA polymerase, sigma 27/28 subunit, RpsK/SigK [Desulfotomaculum arcticum]|uniref:RNA polymerase sigma factor n=1 Tax=Desulfotruncus arcticus DSM 17038 TaxID=1121424 RepID=A0A1I2N7T6_9FIRM|nr:RNA polymerase sporulation sigma factor SigK [Desulfotruncus arcticus]SFF97451.1 RNA polymerase, sigma 27/28 subunit, RpsK/SigK [Desulfotomaculum arcticum] [Desulfotruncus arcticus DSM 17038]